MEKMKMMPYEIAKFIDHTDVKPEATMADIEKLCEEAKKCCFHSVCVTPYRVKDAHHFLGDKNPVGLICVVGFPYGFTTTAEKVNEARSAKDDGATEIDMVINIGAVKDKNWDYVKSEIAAVAKEIKPLGLKVIMEIGFLTRDELIMACKTAKSAGAKFVKTSTGYGPRTPTVEDIKIMRQAVGPNMGVKASGGIHDFKSALAMLEAGANRLGTSSGLEVISVKPELKIKPKGASSKE